MLAFLVMQRPGVLLELFLSNKATIIKNDMLAKKCGT
jgi:hypothetical protein